MTTLIVTVCVAVAVVSGIFAAMVGFCGCLLGGFMTLFVFPAKSLQWCIEARRRRPFVLGAWHDFKDYTDAWCIVAWPASVLVTALLVALVYGCIGLGGWAVVTFGTSEYPNACAVVGVIVGIILTIFIGEQAGI